MLNYFGDVSNMTGANFTENAFKYPNKTSNEPESPEEAVRVG
jgi:hypothetical protein